MIWCFFKNHLAFLCLNTESTPTKMVSMFLTFFNPSVSSCRVSRLIGVYFFVFYSFRLSLELETRFVFVFTLIYCKIPKISPGAYIFQRPFLRGLFLEGLIFGGTYLRREICVSKSIGLAL